MQQILDSLFSRLMPTVAAQEMLRVLLLDGRLYILLLIALAVGITVHEFGHAWMADRIGDPGPRKAGRVSLSPLAHLDPLGALVIAVSALIGFPIGWGKPVHTDPDTYRCSRRTGIGLVAAAGPVMNFITAVALSPFARYCFDHMGDGNLFFLWGFALLAIVMLVNLSLFCFNLIPIFPLDGSHILSGLLPEKASEWYQDFMMRYGVYIFLALLLTGTLGKIIGPLVLALFKRLIGIA